MKKVLLFAVACFASMTVAQAQKVGDSAAAIEANFGHPMASRHKSGLETWFYSTGMKVNFKGGIVTSVSGAPAPTAAVTPAPASVAPISPAPAAKRVVHETTTSSLLARTAATANSRAPRSKAAIRRSENLLLFVVVVASIVCVISNLMMLSRAFGESTSWGIAYLIVPGSGLVFAFLFWDRVKKPALMQIAAVVASAITVIAVRMR